LVRLESDGEQAISSHDSRLIITIIDA
jgi:hypothetical protein